MSIQPALMDCVTGYVIVLNKMTGRTDIVLISPTTDSIVYMDVVDIYLVQF